MNEKALILTSRQPVHISQNENISEAKKIQDYRSNRDNELLLLLFKPYISLVFGVCLKYLGDKMAAEDAVQEIFEILTKKLPENDVKDFRPWLYVLTKNHCLQLLRKQSSAKPKEIEAAHMYSEQIMHPDDIGQEDRLQRMEACMEKLVKTQRECIDLFYFEKKSYQEITDILELEWKQVRSYIQNARRNIKNCMETHES